MYASCRSGQVHEEVMQTLRRVHSIHIVQYDVTINQNYQKEKLKGGAGLDWHQGSIMQAADKFCVLSDMPFSFEAIC